jgi:hypothetical protein
MPRRALSGVFENRLDCERWAVPFGLRYPLAVIPAQPARRPSAMRNTAMPLIDLDALVNSYLGWQQRKWRLGASRRSQERCSNAPRNLLSPRLICFQCVDALCHVVESSTLVFSDPLRIMHSLRIMNALAPAIPQNTARGRRGRARIATCTDARNFCELRCCCFDLGLRLRLHVTV